MKIVVIGTGAMGSVYAGLLADAGHDVCAIDQWGDHIEAICERGLRVEGASGDRVVWINAATEAAAVGASELVIISTKAKDAAAAARSALPILTENSVVLTIQNGLGAIERVAGIVGRERLLVGIVGGFGAEIRAPGHVFHNGWELVHIGEAIGELTPRLEKVADVWRSAGFSVRTYTDIERMVWEKFICNVCFSGTSAVTGLTIGEVMEDPHAWQIASRCATEAWQVATEKGIALGIDDPVRYVREFGSKIPDATPSMALDIAAERPSEIDVINGAVPDQAKEVGLEAPYNEVVTALVRRLESQYR